MDPAKSYISAMGEKIKSIAPDIVADPKIDKSIFRIHRDVRFSKDKSPYKTYMGIWLWEGDRKKMENSGFYLHLDPPKLMLGVGVYQFPKPLLKQYRESVVHPEFGPDLAARIAEVEKNGSYSVGGKHYKRTPRGYDQDHERADLLLYNGLHVGINTDIPAWFFTNDVIEHSYKIFNDMLPIHQWLKAMVKRAS